MQQLQQKYLRWDYIYIQSFYRTLLHNITPKFLGNSVSGLAGAAVVNTKKGNLIRNRQGFVINKSVSNSSTSQPELEFSFYSLNESGQLILDHKKLYQIRIMDILMAYLIVLILMGMV